MLLLPSEGTLSGRRTKQSDGLTGSVLRAAEPLPIHLMGELESQAVHWYRSKSYRGDNSAPPVHLCHDSFILNTRPSSRIEQRCQRYELLAPKYRILHHDSKSEQRKALSTSKSRGANRAPGEVGKACCIVHSRAGETRTGTGVAVDAAGWFSKHPICNSRGPVRFRPEISLTTESRAVPCPEHDIRSRTEIETVRFPSYLYDIGRTPPVIPAIGIQNEAISEFCNRHRIRRFSLF